MTVAVALRLVTGWQNRPTLLLLPLPSPALWLRECSPLPHHTDLAIPTGSRKQGERHEPKFIAPPHPAHDLSFCPLLLSSSVTPFSSTLKKHGARRAAPLAVRCGPDTPRSAAFQLVRERLGLLPLVSGTLSGSAR
jgi:hypothetical protein